MPLDFSLALKMQLFACQRCIKKLDGFPQACWGPPEVGAVGGYNLFLGDWYGAKPALTCCPKSYHFV